MKALICSDFGPPPRLCVQDVAPLRATANELLIEVRATGVNFRDLLAIQNKYQRTPTPPFGPGCEVVGVVADVGPEVHGWRRGDRVMGFTDWGGIAEAAVVPAAAALPVPEGMEDDTAAAFLLCYGTADHGLRDRAAIARGETLVVLGAAGAAGLAAVDVGKALGARVIACASTNAKLEACREHGADVLINYANSDLKRSLRDAVGDGGIDVAYDCVGGAAASTVVRAMAWRGRFVVVGFASGDIPSLPLNVLLTRGASAIGIWWGEFVRREPEAFLTSGRYLAQWYADGLLRPRVSRVYPLDRAAEALDAISTREAVGKIVVSTRSSHARPEERRQRVASCV